MNKLFLEISRDCTGAGSSLKISDCFLIGTLEFIRHVRREGNEEFHRQVIDTG